MKKTKKFIALLLFAAMSFSMLGAGLLSDKDFPGTYAMEFDMTEMAVALFDEGTEMGDTLSLGDYLSEMTVMLKFEFRDDGTYRIYMDEESFIGAVGQLREAAIPFFDDMIFLLLVGMLADEGIEVHSREEIEALLDMSFEEMYMEFLGMSVEEYVDATLAEAFSFENIEQELSTEGKYKAVAGKLYTTASLDEELSYLAYEEYTLEGDTLTISGGVNVEESDLLVYPAVFTRLEDEAA